jgi:hypothetical protein
VSAGRTSRGMGMSFRDWADNCIGSSMEANAKNSEPVRGNCMD